MEVAYPRYERWKYAYHCNDPDWFSGRHRGQVAHAGTRPGWLHYHDAAWYRGRIHRSLRWGTARMVRANRCSRIHRLRGWRHGSAADLSLAVSSQNRGSAIVCYELRFTAPAVAGAFFC